MSRLYNLIPTPDMTSCIVVLVIGLLFLNPFPHVTAFKEIFFYSACGLAILAAVTRKKVLSFETPFLCAFLFILLWSTIGLPFAVNKTNTLHDIYAHLIKYFAFYFLIINFFESKEKIILLCWTIIFSTASFCIWSLFYFYFFLGHSIDQQLGVYVFKEIPTNVIGIVTVFGIVLSLRMLYFVNDLSSKVAIILMLAAILLATFLTQTRSAIIALFCVLALLSLRNRFQLIIIMILIIPLFILPIKNRLTPDAIIDKIKNESRIKISYTYIEIIKEFPLKGIGFGLQSYADIDFLKKYHNQVDPSKRSETIVQAPHNFFIDILVRLGIIGLVLYLYLLYKTLMITIKLAIDRKNEFIREWGFTLFCAFIASLIQGMFENVHSGPPAIVFYLQLALITILWKRYRTE